MHSLIYFGSVVSNSEFFIAQESIRAYLSRTQEIHVENIFLRQPLRSFIPAQIVHSFRLNSSPRAKPQFCTAAGTFARILSHNLERNLVTLKLPSGTLLQVSGNRFATSGAVSNTLHKALKLKKAGQNR